MHSTAFLSTFPVLRAQQPASKRFVRSTLFKRVRIFCNAQRQSAHLPVQSQPSSSPLAPKTSNVHNDELVDDVNTKFDAGVFGAYLAITGLQAVNAVPEILTEAFKSTPASLVHPGVMWTLLATCLFTFYLGYQSSLIRKSEPVKRKELLSKKVTDRHFKTSSALFAVMTFATFAGMANTFTRTGKLFPGPHLYAGLGLVATMSAMVAFVPYMQKGKEWAKQAHFTLAFLTTGLFGWQAKSGMAIVAKLLGWE